MRVQILLHPSAVKRETWPLLRRAQRCAGGVGMRSTLMVCSPGSHLKGDLRRPDERGPFFLSALQEKHHSGRVTKSWAAPAAGGALGSCFLVPFPARGTTEAPGGGWQLGQGPGAHCGSHQMHTQGMPGCTGGGCEGLGNTVRTKSTLRLQQLQGENSL